MIFVKLFIKYYKVKRLNVEKIITDNFDSEWPLAARLNE
jgi:hypothetical protein